MRFHALIIEDDNALRELYALYLQRGGMDTTTVASAQRALDVLESQSIDLVLVDVNLADDMSGLDFIRIVQDIPEYDPIKIVILTSFPEPYDATISRRIDLSLNKPVDYTHLMAALNSIL